MQPIVDGLRAEFSGAMAFVYLNAADGGEGQRIFQTLRLPGHPGFVLFTPNGAEQYRAFGIVGEDTLRAAIVTALPAEIAAP